MSEPVVKNGNIANGFTSIAEYLGVDANTTTFINSLITNPKSPVDFKMSDTDGLDWRSAQYVTPLTAAGSHTVTFEVSPLHTSYLKKYVAQGDLQFVPATGRAYPGGSIPAILTKQEAEGSLPAGIRNSKLFNSFQTEEMAQLSEKLGFTPVVSTEAYLNFLSKAYVHEIASGTSLSTAPGLVFAQPAPVADYVQDIQAMGDLKKIWIKASSLSGGQGIIPVENPTPESIKAAFGTIAKAYKDAGFYCDGAAPTADKPFDGINFFMPVVVEADIDSIPGTTEVLANACVQAVVAKDQITLVGTSLQKTKDGEYIGAALPLDASAPEIKIAEAEAAKLLQKMSKDGYVGYAGVDVIVTKNEQGEIKPFVLEVNPRLNASTPLLTLVQNAEAKTGEKIYAMTVTHTFADFSDKNDKAQSVYKTIGNQDLYRASETSFEGILPYMLDTVDNLKTTFRVAILAKSPEKLEQLGDALQQRVKSQDAFVKNVRAGL